MEGVNLGRAGSIELIQFATPKMCFLMDVAPGKWQKEILAFAKSILENPEILKIIHDPSSDADALLHLYGINVTNVHDTQASHMVLRPDVKKRPNLNASLTAFGCPSNESRDKDVYQTQPRFWGKRPLTKQMIDWAANDVNLLFALYKKQILDPRWDMVRTTAREASEQRLNAHRGGKLLRIHSTQIGLFIGKAGSNLRKLETLTGAEFGTLLRDEGLFIICATNSRSLQSAIDATQKYTVPRKNSRREGDWTCTGCGCSNFTTREICRDCGQEHET
eukprot:gb/GEZN01009449.1/.p1 GENE.gb/GEZN01009449.1/~~gb/GEZN01009449.1/.p1  ORF type:complete len:277 (-),score=20.91 gb/GEZN01009449.1/:228-1058(-)